METQLLNGLKQVCLINSPINHILTAMTQNTSLGPPSASCFKHMTSCRSQSSRISHRTLRMRAIANLSMLLDAPFLCIYLSSPVDTPLRPSPHRATSIYWFSSHRPSYAPASRFRLNSSLFSAAQYSNSFRVLRSNSGLVTDGKGSETG